MQLRPIGRKFHLAHAAGTSVRTDRDERIGCRRVSASRASGQHAGAARRHRSRRLHRVAGRKRARSRRRRFRSRAAVDSLDEFQGASGSQWADFGIEKKPGPRHLRIGFKEAIPVGTVLTRGNIQLSVLKQGGIYPGNLDEDEQWIHGRRLADGAITTAQAGRDECVLWVFPARNHHAGTTFHPPRQSD